MSKEKDYSFKNTAFKSVAWKFLERGLTNGAQFVIGIILARLLMPSDYGVVAILGIFIAVSGTLIDSGLSQVVIQDSKRTEDDFSVMFITNLALSLGLYAILYFSAPYIADFYDIPLLTSVTQVYSLILLVNALSIVSKTRITINLDFKTQATITVVSILSSGVVGITMAYSGMGVWALVCQQLCYGIVQSVAYNIKSKNIKRWTYPLARAKKNFMLGYKLLIANLLHTLYTNTQPIIIGKFYSSAQLGFFSRGDQMIKILPLNISDVLSNTMFPVFCKYKEGGSIEEFKHRFLKYQRLVAFLIFPFMIYLVAIAKPLILLLLTDKWSGCIVYMQILGFAYMMDPLLRLNSFVPTLYGRTDIQLKNETIKKIVAFALIIAGAAVSIAGMCVAMVLYSFFDMLITTHFMKKIVNISFFDEVKAIMFPAVYNLAVLVLLFGVNAFILNNVAVIAIDLCVVAVSFFCLIKIFRVEELFLLTGFLKSKIHR